MVKSNLYHAGTAAFLAAFAIVSVDADQPLTSTELPDGTGAALASEASFRFPADLTVKLFAAEPQLMNPVAISVDPKGQVFVAEEYRFNRGTEENRTRPFLLEDDLQISNLEDRYAAFEKYQDRFEGGMEWFTRYTDQVRVLSDSDGDGRADVSRVFASGFNQPLEGLLAGVLAHEGDVFVANIPNLWRLRDTDTDGVADDRQILLSGFGINAGFLGHDLHGLVVGPDGKLYFSVGDRGFHVIDREGVAHSLPRRGAVFRCNLDGSQFEVLHIGLRNPQELAFDEYGNLLAADNNCDKGDYSRLVLIVPGGDSGWNMAFQSIPEPYQTGPWMAEAMWHLESEKQSQDLRPAWVLPPIGKLGAGPSGFAYCGAAGWSQDYRGRFYMCNYTGNGGIESFALEPNGASLRMVDERDLIKPIQATDCDFGFDGRLYISDFVGLEWNGGSKGGRIYVLSPKTTMESPAIQDTSIKSPPVHNLGQATDSSEVSTGTWFIQQSIDTWDINQLVPWIKHSDYRVRQRAQFAIAKHGAAGIDAMKRIAIDSGLDPRVRLHGVWGLGQLLPDDSAVEALLLTSRDADPWIRSNTAKLLGNRDLSDEAALRVESRLMELLQDSDARVSMQAAFSAGCLRMRQSIPSLFSLAKSNQGHDKYLRHSIVHALTHIGDREAVQARSSDTDREIRMICLLTMRHWRDPTIGDFLNDSDWWLVTEAACAIHDVRIESQQPLLANLTNRPDIALAPEPLLRRIIGANYLLGTTDALQHVIDLSCDPGLPTKIRQEAFLAIESWHLPSSRDRVTGDWRPSNPRNMDTIQPVLAKSLPALLGAAENTLAELMSIVDRYDLPLQSAQLRSLAEE